MDEAEFAGGKPALHGIWPMVNGLYISAEGAYAQDRRLEVVANNLANVDTVGFKRELAVFQSNGAGGVDSGWQMSNSNTAADIDGGVALSRTTTDYSAGPLVRTGGRSDMAIKGSGFFMVRKGNEDLLTRAGNFAMTSRGELVTTQGYPVLNESGSPVVIDPDDPSWKTTADGSIWQQGGKQSLAIVEPNSLGDLVKMGENLFRPLAPPQPVSPADRQVATGHLEMSTVKSTTEMTELIQASRFLEANVNLIKMQDEMQRGLINRVMSTS